jgi:hypothetical protein
MNALLRNGRFLTDGKGYRQLVACLYKEGDSGVYHFVHRRFTLVFHFKPESARRMSPDVLELFYTHEGEPPIRVKSPELIREAKQAYRVAVMKRYPR